jgi:hypothetical protein
MPDYNKACIYLIKHKLDFNNENVYIGSCCNFTRRKWEHKSNCNNPNSQRHNLKLYQEIREKDGWYCWVMIKLHEYKCESKYELNLEERRVIDEYKAKLNCQLPTRTIKEWCEENKEKIVEYDKEYYHENKEKILKRNKKYNEEHKEMIADNKKKYYEENKEIILQKSKEKYEKNREKYLEKNKKYYEKNKEKLAEQSKVFRESNKEKLAEKGREIIKCDKCGSEITKIHLSRHKTTKKCLNYN